MPVPDSISKIIQPAVAEIISGAKAAVGITTDGTYHPGTESDSTRYLALLLFGYMARSAIDSLPANAKAAKAGELMKWVYGSTGSGGMRGLKDINTQGLFTPPVTFHNSDPINVLAAINAVLERIAVPTIPDWNAEESVKNIVQSLDAKTDWFTADPGFGRILLLKAKVTVYPFLAVRLLGFLPETCPWAGYKGLSADAIKAATEVLGAGNPAIILDTASFLVQCSTLAQMAKHGAYQCVPPDAETLNSTIGKFKAFMGSGKTDDINRVKSFLESDYNRLNFGTIADTWSIIDSPTATAAAGESSPSAEAPSPRPAAAAVSPVGDTGSPLEDPTKDAGGYAMPNGLDRRSYTLLQKMAVDENQLMQALEFITTGDYNGTAFLTTYQPGITERAIIKLLDEHTDKGSHRPLTGDAAKSATGKKTIMIPPAFKVDQSQAIWTKAVVTDLGFPFINFTSPPIMELIRGTDPKAIRAAYKKVKGMFRQCGLKKPIDTLKEFAHAQYRNCSLNSLVVDADDIFNVEQGQTVSASVVNPYSKNLQAKGSFGMPIDFATAFYGVLSPVKASRQYCELCGMSPEEYIDHLEEHGKPPVYILSPKRAAFKRGPKGGLLHELFSSKTKPILVRSRVGNHDGGFMIPERVADLLFSM